MQKYTAVRAMLFLVLAIVFLMSAVNKEPSWEQALFYAFAVLDFVWGSYLLRHFIKSQKN